MEWLHTQSAPTPPPAPRKQKNSPNIGGKSAKNCISLSTFIRKTKITLKVFKMDTEIKEQVRLEIPDDSLVATIKNLVRPSPPAIRRSRRETATLTSVCWGEGDGEPLDVEVSEHF
jgi:hypothetical protein